VKKQTKGVIAIVGFGTLLLFWGAAASLPGIVPPPLEEEITITGSPADNFPDIQRAQFCETGNAKSNSYIKEYKIPTPCTQPLAIVTDPQGNVWFAQTNTGNVAKFDPTTESFTEYENPLWPEGARSMMWGIDYSPDDSIWYTDERFDSLWKFSILDEKYQPISYPSSGDSLPQKLEIVGSNVIVNDFTGSKITFLDAAQIGEDVRYLNLQSPINGSVTGDFAIDDQDNLWYTNWVFQQGGFVVKFDQEKYSSLVNSETNEIVPFSETNQIYQFPLGLNTPNGLTIGPNGKIWLADTSSSFFFSFDPNSEAFTKYITTDPPFTTYGNSSGSIKTIPGSRPYWISLDDVGRIIFNEQAANRIGIFDPEKESLVEYLIPSKNPNWADCGSLPDCGLAQVFDFTARGDKIWFTEWVENNIGVLDTSVPLPFQIDLDTQNITLEKGEQQNIILTINDVRSTIPIQIVSSDTADFSDLIIIPEIQETNVSRNESLTISFSIKAGDNALSITHKVILGAQTDNVTISKYVTVTIKP